MILPNQNAILTYALTFYRVSNYRQLSLKTNLAEESISRIRKGSRGLPKKWMDKFMLDTGMSMSEVKAISESSVAMLSSAQRMFPSVDNSLTDCIKQTNLDLKLTD